MRMKKPNLLTNPEPHISLVSVNNLQVLHADGKEIAKRSKDGKRWISRMEWDVRDEPDGVLKVHRLTDSSVWRLKLKTAA